MKSVICIYDGMGYFPNDSIRLTKGKIYEVDEIISDNVISITDNLGDQVNYSMVSGNIVWFEDSKSHIREYKLNELGI
jgi:hypothetical protein